MPEFSPLPLNIAHRGARSLAPENTLLAAQAGLQAGADLWELDTALTLDGQLVVIHDDTLERTSNAAQAFPNRGPWRIETFSLAELRRLDFGSWFVESDPFGQIRAGAVSALAAHRFAGATIPTLNEALAFTQANGWRVNVEIKDQTGTPGDALIAPAVVRLVEDLGLTAQVIVSSFNHAYLRQARALNPAIALAALVEEPAPDPLALLADLGAQAYNPGLETLDLGQVQAVRTAGYGVNVWTVNDPADMRRLIEAGVSGIFTDFPQRLKQVLEEYR